jgi:geranylgeranyl pyrophosphate synthase
MRSPDQAPSSRRTPLPLCSGISERHKRLAEIMEMIHTASLVHDDVLDECNIRRGKETINSTYGTRVAVLAGDYLFAQSSWFLANLENIEVGERGQRHACLPACALASAP